MNFFFDQKIDVICFPNFEINILAYAAAEILLIALSFIYL